MPSMSTRSGGALVTKSGRIGPGALPGPSCMLPLRRSFGHRQARHATRYKKYGCASLVNSHFFPCAAARLARCKELANFDRRLAPQPWQSKLRRLPSGRSMAAAQAKLLGAYDLHMQAALPRH